MIKIDAHNHPDFLGMGIQKFIANMDENGIDKTVLLTDEKPWEEIYMNELGVNPSPLAASEEHCIPFNRCLDFYEKAPERFILGYCPDPRRPQAVHKMKSAIHTYGVKVCGEVKFRTMYDNPDCIDMFRYCGEQGVPAILHFDVAGAQIAPKGSYWRHYWYGGDINTLERLLELCPETNFLGHAPGFWACISNDDLWKTVDYPQGPVIPGGHIERLLEKFPNLYCDCSAYSALAALSRDSEYTKKLIMTFPDRFVYARDNFEIQLAPFIDSLGLSQDVLEMFYHKNIERLIGEGK